MTHFFKKKIIILYNFKGLFEEGDNQKKNNGTFGLKSGPFRLKILRKSSRIWT